MLCCMTIAVGGINVASMKSASPMDEERKLLPKASWVCIQWCIIQKFRP